MLSTRCRFHGLWQCFWHASLVHFCWLVVRWAKIWAHVIFHVKVAQSTISKIYDGTSKSKFTAHCPRVHSESWVCIQQKMDTSTGTRLHSVHMAYNTESTLFFPENYSTNIQPAHMVMRRCRLHRGKRGKLASCPIHNSPSKYSISLQ